MWVFAFYIKTVKCLGCEGMFKVRANSFLKYYQFSKKGNHAECNFPACIRQVLVNRAGKVPVQYMIKVLMKTSFYKTTHFNEWLREKLF